MRTITVKAMRSSIEDVDFATDMIEWYGEPECKLTHGRWKIIKSFMADMLDRSSVIRKGRKSLFIYIDSYLGYTLLLISRIEGEQKINIDYVARAGKCVTTFEGTRI